MIELTKKEDCCGCGSCANICPRKCISMKSDNEGFLYPEVNIKECINCGLCNQSCPIINVPADDKNKIPFSYIAQNKDLKIRNESSSGGMFSSLAQYILEKKGTVFGAAFDENWNVKHISITSVDDLGKLRGSKYVQSDTGFIYQEIKKLLLKDEWVCFSGTPCQTVALRSFLKKDFPKLLLVDVVCHGVPSPKVWNMYVNFHTTKYGHLDKVFFRNKEFGFAGSTMALHYKSGKRLYLGQELQFHKACFFKDLSTRPSCYECKFKAANRVSDFTIFDCWHANVFEPTMDDDKGTSGVLIHSEKGLSIFKDISKELIFKQVDFEKLVQLDGSMVLGCIKPNSKRAEFFKDLDQKSLEELMRKYTPLTLKKKIIQLVKPFLAKIGILNKLKRKLKKWI